MRRHLFMNNRNCLGYPAWLGRQNHTVGAVVLQPPALATSASRVEKYAGVDGLGIHVQAYGAMARGFEILELVRGLPAIHYRNGSVGGEAGATEQLHFDGPAAG